MAHALEKRGYVKAGPWTPECTVEHPDGGQLTSQPFVLQSLKVESHIDHFNLWKKENWQSILIESSG